MASYILGTISSTSPSVREFLFLKPLMQEQEITKPEKLFFKRLNTPIIMCFYILKHSHTCACPQKGNNQIHK